ncbi:MAG: IS200/IS605 family transposase [Bacteroidales bacterium]|nr:IS200/IS605 family transposase [Bacteroidales bacterium]
MNIEHIAVGFSQRKDKQDLTGALAPLYKATMSWVRIWIHSVFSTKNREHFLIKHIRNEVFQHIQKNAKEKDIWLNTLGGYSDHIHCLVSLGRDQSISKVAQLIKGESSFWINKVKLTESKFAWQDDFWAVSVSESHTEKVRDYIKNQEIHHKTSTFTEEIDEFMEKNGWAIIRENN